MLLKYKGLEILFDLVPFQNLSLEGLLTTIIDS
jgi:hypothetical protein